MVCSTQYICGRWWAALECMWGLAFETEAWAVWRGDLGDRGVTGEGGSRDA